MYKGSAASGVKTGCVCVCATLVAQGFSNLPSLARSHSLSPEILNSEQPPFLQTFLGNVGMWE